MTKYDIFPASDLHTYLKYDAATGLFIWRERTQETFQSFKSYRVWNARFAGKQAFTALNSHGYIQGTLFGRKITAHRVAWAIVYGEWPSQSLDHINGIRTDNRIENLRLATAAVNNRNSGLRRNNKSGHNGVSWYSQTNRWVAHARFDGKDNSLGYFVNLEDAIAARQQADEKHGYHSNHGKRRAA